MHNPFMQVKIQMARPPGAPILKPPDLDPRLDIIRDMIIRRLQKFLDPDLRLDIIRLSGGGGFTISPRRICVHHTRVGVCKSNIR